MPRPYVLSKHIDWPLDGLLASDLWRTPTVALMQWWTTRGAHASDQKVMADQLPARCRHHIGLQPNRSVRLQPDRTARVETTFPHSHTRPRRRSQNAPERVCCTCVSERFRARRSADTSVQEWQEMEKWNATS
jgi:hypothetical protein